MARQKSVKQRKITKMDGQLEIDHDRGVIYFHPHNAAYVEVFNGLTALRIQGLPTIPVKPKSMLDVRLCPTSDHCSWATDDTADGWDREANAIQEVGPFIEARLKERVVKKFQFLNMMLICKGGTYSLVPFQPPARQVLS